jgi:hypothetical protein
MTTYDQDFYSWALEQARLLRDGHFTQVDVLNIAEELEDMGHAKERALESQLTRLLAHLLKWHCQPEGRAWSGNSWRASIRESRKALQKLLRKNPGLKPHLAELFDEAYDSAVNWAIAETNLPQARFPVACPWTLEQAIDEEFWPP